MFLVVLVHVFSSIGTDMVQHFSVWGHGGSSVGVTLEVRLHRLVMGENGRRESGKNPRVGYARRGIRI